VDFTIYVIRVDQPWVALLAPIKRLLSRGNTSPSQKMISFFAGSVSSFEEDPFCYLLRCFQVFWFKPLTDLLPGTHQDQGHLRKIKLAVAKRRDLHYLGAKQPSFFFTTPGPESGPQKNIGTLSCPMGCDKIKGSNRANHRGLMTRADHKKDIRLDFRLRECNGVPTKLQGF